MVHLLITLDEFDQVILVKQLIISHYEISRQRLDELILFFFFSKVPCIMEIAMLVALLLKVLPVFLLVLSNLSSFGVSGTKRSLMHCHFIFTNNYLLSFWKEGSLEYILMTYK